MLTLVSHRINSKQWIDLLYVVLFGVALAGLGIFSIMRKQRAQLLVAYPAAIGLGFTLVCWAIAFHWWRCLATWPAPTPAPSQPAAPVVSAQG
ncbi:hypothetical protein DB346_15835 [Verrucomicrobia bacterium LW23]|nr:hypothetical protein DB346_15835 [Verrucomicrobia bacterium LW23]